MEDGLQALAPKHQLEVWGARATDTRPRIRTGFASMDKMLNRGGFAPGELVIFGGRTRTRKTTTVLNMVAHMLRDGVKVGFVGLDEPVASYVAKFASVLLDESHMTLEDDWQSDDVQRRLQEYRRLAHRLVLSKGYRPSFEQLHEWVEAAGIDDENPMRVMVVDYVSLLSRDKYAGAEVQRIPRLIEALQVFTNEHDLVTIALHQVGRMDEGSGGRYHGDTPMSLEGLKYGGEEIADVVMSTYRPALDPVGNLELEDAFAYFPDGWKEEKVVEAWERARERVTKYPQSTFLQLLKNRPGTETHDKGIRLESPSKSMRMVEYNDLLGEDMKRRAS